MSEPKLTVDRLWKIYDGGKRGEVVAIEDLSLAVHANEFVSLVGPSGCGKSTLLMMAAGLEPISAGDIRCDDRPVTGPGPDRGMVFQTYTLFPWLNVADNIRFALKKSGLPCAEQDARVAEHIRLVGLEGFEAAHPNQLSGGMRQRVAFMRTLAFSPEVILLDEPFSALDSQTRLILQSDVMRIIRERQCSVVLVTHDVGEAITMADRIVVITSRPGRVKSVHRVDIAPELRHPLKIRTLPRFNQLFETIWSELGIELAA